MINKKLEKRIRLKKKIRSKIFGTLERPRFSVFRSNNFIYAQIINDTKGLTLVSSSDLSISNVVLNKKKNTKTESSKLIGIDIAKKALAKGIKMVIFDRNGFKFTGRIKALADSARESGLIF